MKEYSASKAKEAAIAAKKKQEEEARKAKAAAEAAAKAEAGPTFEEVSEEEAAKIEAAEKAKKEGTPVPEEEKGEKKEEDVEDEKDKGVAPNAGNGGKTDKYEWTQTLQEATVNVFLPAGIKAKDLNVVIKKKHLKIALKTKPNEPIVDGPLHKEVKTDETIWSVQDENGQRVLSINFEKVDQMGWWKCVIEGDQEINTQKVEPENSKLSDLDGETRSTVEKMMFDQQQKQKGLPTSDELDKRSKLEAFMKAHPEMDFSKAKFA